MSYVLFADMMLFNLVSFHKSETNNTKKKDTKVTESANSAKVVN